MSSTNPCHYTTDLLPAYMLGALDGAELSMLREHTADCPDCGTQMQQWAPGRDLLLIASQSTAPSRELRDRVMQEVRREAALLQSAREPAPITRADDSSRPASDGRWAARRERWVGWPALVLSAVGLMVVLTFGSPLAGPDRGAPSRAAVRQVAAQGLGTQTTASGALRMYGSPRLAALDVHGLATLRDGRAYQVWVLPRNATTPQSAEVFFNASASGDAGVLITRRLSRGDQVLVTAEPAGGSKQPTSDPVLGVTV